MKTTTLTNPFVGDNDVSSFPWRSITSIIIWKLERREKEIPAIISSINDSIIIDLTASIEGFLNEIFDIAISNRTDFDSGVLAKDYKRFSSSNSFEQRMFDFLQQKLESSTWSSYNEIFKVIFGEGIKDEINAEVWKGISTLFTYRNLIVHGKILTVSYFQIEETDNFEIKIQGKYKTIYSYLTEKKLVIVDSLGYIKLMSNEIADHFVKTTRDFMKQVIIIIPDNEDKDFIKQVIDIFK